ncbi:MAG TPA: hypothetical protein EYP79_02230 [Campylobacterales bacterium]|nr:hypothetical protein [Campylobacterales bacterium]
MKKTISKELSIYFAIFFLLSLAIHHKEWILHPLDHLRALPHSQFGLFHPFIFSFGAYISVLIVRIFIKIIKKAINRVVK